MSKVGPNGGAWLSSEFRAFETVASVGELAEGIGVPVVVAGRAIALFLVDGRYYAIDDSCPHKALPLYDGIVVDRTVICLAHGWQFDLTDGRNFENPRLCIGTYPVRVLGDEIQVAVGGTSAPGAR